MSYRFPFVFILFAVAVVWTGCEQRNDLVFIKQYESALKAKEPDYEFVSFQLSEPYTLEDSLQDELSKAQQLYDRFADKFDNEMRRSRSIFIENQNEEALRLAHDHLKSMEKFDSVRQELSKKIKALSKEENKVLQKTAVHTYKSQGTLKKVIVRFDEADHLLSTGTPQPVNAEINQ